MHGDAVQCKTSNKAEICEQANGEIKGLTYENKILLKVGKGLDCSCSLCKTQNSHISFTAQPSKKKEKKKTNGAKKVTENIAQPASRALPPPLSASIITAFFLFLSSDTCNKKKKGRENRATKPHFSWLARPGRGDQAALRRDEAAGGAGIKHGDRIVSCFHGPKHAITRDTLCFLLPIIAGLILWHVLEPSGELSGTERNKRA